MLTLSPDRSTIYTGSHDGYITDWNAKTGENNRVQGQGHGNQINGMKAADNLLYTAGIDDTLRSVDIATNSYAETAVVKLDSQPRGLDVCNDTVVVASVQQVNLTYELTKSYIIKSFVCDNHVIRWRFISQIAVTQNGRKMSSVRVDYEPSCVTINQETGDVAIGSTSDNKVSYLYENKRNVIMMYLITKLYLLCRSIFMD